MQLAAVKVHFGTGDPAKEKCRVVLLSVGPTIREDEIELIF